MTWACIRPRRVPFETEASDFHLPFSLLMTLFLLIAHTTFIPRVMHFLMIFLSEYHESKTTEKRSTYAQTTSMVSFAISIFESVFFEYSFGKRGSCISVVWRMAVKNWCPVMKLSEEWSLWLCVSSTFLPSCSAKVSSNIKEIFCPFVK